MRATTLTKDSEGIPNYSPTNPGQEADVSELIVEAERAATIARTKIPNAFLRQINFDPDGKPVSFRFTDSQALRVLHLHGNSDSPLNQWNITYGASKFHPVKRAWNLSSLRFDGGAIAQLAKQHWPTCNDPLASLVGEGNEHSWVVSCMIEDGSVAANVDDSTGEFRQWETPRPIFAPVAPPS